MKINENYLRLEESYLFASIAHKLAAWKEANPRREVIRLGIGDVTLPLVPAVTEAMHKAVDEMGRQETFHGYGPEQGYPFLREAVCGYYAARGTIIGEDEIFVSDGAKSDLGNILDVLSLQNTVLIPDPVYPVYVDTNVMAGRDIRYLSANRENGFLPLPDQAPRADIIYLCSPNNPTGAAYSREALRRWVAYAQEHGALILYDAAYEAFVCEEALARSIYEIDGARECAIEFCSLSKTAGFTGTRCGYTVVPKSLSFGGHGLHALWLRRQTTKFNGVPYIVQRGAQAVFSPEGQRQTRANLDYYRGNAALLAGALQARGVWYTGGKNSPYIWMKCPDGMSSWEFFDYLLERAGIVGTPGSGFGPGGEGYFRLTAFGDRGRTEKAAGLLKEIL
ncbi:MAG: LL-diaminopimelate aminotransferase [Clostridiales bacterium]|uniref:LL-diaminopimelate aminotransferase n=1 Tax=Provencibacterium massiliense TaxID=1841868 RepID=UPI0009A6A12A|nr:LL-diaminopimelate aminotransferase [Provencibacterium massiliense]PWM35412.1 MAG: LL-diaminopimelate aminotransferase [Clostridiales bacterium]RGB69680.1 LL-diaminopimelate aminotransferase [Harryflintia acetispora]